MTVQTQMRICFAVPAVTTGPAVSVWTRVDEHCTAVERLGCMVASSVAAWCVHMSNIHKIKRNSHTFRKIVGGREGFNSITAVSDIKFLNMELKLN